MPEEDNSLDASGGSKLYDATSSSLETTAPVVQSIPARRRPSLFKFNRLAFTVTGGALAAIAIIVGIAFLFNQAQNSKANEIAGKKGSYDVSTISTNGVEKNDALKVGTADSLDVNGQLQVSNTVVLTPTSAPTAPEAGQIYFDKTLNSLFYYNGSVFVPVANQNSVVSSLGGLTGAINPGAGLSAVGGSLQNTGVLSVQGQSGTVTFTAGGGIDISGTTISTTALPAGQLVLGTGTNGFTTVAQANTPNQCLISTAGAPVFGSCTGTTQVTSLNGLINGLTLAEGSGITITPSGGNTLTIASTAGNAITAVNGQTGPTLTVDNATSNVANHITINNASANGSTKGIAAFNATNFSDNGSGVINTIQGISTAATPTFAGLTSTGSIRTATGLTSNGTDLFTVPTHTGGGVLCVYNAGDAFANCPVGGNVSRGASASNNRLTKFDANNGNVTDSSLLDQTSGLQVTSSGYYLDLSNGGASTFTIKNTNGSNVANLIVTGKVTASQGLLNGSDTFTLPTNGGNGGVLCYLYSGTSNCPTGGNVSRGGSVTTNKVAIFDASGNIVNSSLLDQTSGLQVSTSSYYLDLNSGSASTLTLKNTGAGAVANLSLTGKLSAAQGFLQGSDTYTLPTNGGNGGVICYLYSGTSNCPTGGDVSYDGTHTDGTIAMFTPAGVVDSSLLQTGVNLSTAGSFTASGGIITNSITNNAAANSPTNDLQIISTNNNIQFSINGGARVFTFDTGGSTQYQTICTTGISCASGGGTAVLLEGTGPQVHTSSDPGIWLNTTTGTGALIKLAVSGIDKFVINNKGELESLLLNGGTAGTDYVKLQSASRTGALTLNVPAAAAGTADICLSTGNCIGSGAGIGGGGTNGKIALFTPDGSHVGDSALTQSGSDITSTGSLTLQGGSATLGVAGPAGTTGSIAFKHSASAFTGTLIQGALSASQTYTLPDATGEVCLTSGNCIGGSSGGAPSSAQYLTLALDSGLTNERVLTAGTNIAALSDTGANGTLTISVANNPTFSGLVTASAGLTIAAGQTFTFNSDAFTDLTGTGLIISSGALQASLGTSVDLTSEVTGILPVANGGTGVGTLTTKGVLYGNGTGVVQATAAGTSGQLLLANATGVPTFTTLGGDATVDNTGSLTVNKLQGNTLTVGSIASGDVLQYNGSAIVSGHITNSNLTAGTFVNITGTGALAAGSIASGFGTISTGNNITTSATVQGGTVNGTTSIQLNGTNINTAGTLSNVAYLNAATNTFTGNLAQTGTGTVSTGTGAISLNGDTTVASGKTFTLQGSGTSSLIAKTGAGDQSTLSFLTGSKNLTYRFDGSFAGYVNNTTYDVCTSVGNCVGSSGGGVASTGTTLYLPVFSTDGFHVVNSIISQDAYSGAAYASVAGKLKVTTLGTADNSNILCKNTAGEIATCSSLGVTLQTAYAAGSGGTTPDILVNSSVGGVDIQNKFSGGVSGGNLLSVRGSSATDITTGTTEFFGVTDTGTVNVNTAGSGVTNINTGTGSGAVNIGNSTGNTAITLQGGTSTITASSTATTGTAMSVQGNSVTTGTGLSLAVNALTSGTGLNVSTSSANNLSGNLASISQTGSYSGLPSVQGNTLNVSRNLSGSISGAATVTLDAQYPSTGTAAVGTTANPSIATWNHTVANKSNRILVVTVTGKQYWSACTVTYGGVSMLKVADSFQTDSDNSASIYVMVAPPIGTAQVVANCPSAFTNTVHATSTSWYNVSQTTPYVATTPVASNSITLSAATSSATAANDMAIVAYSSRGTHTTGAGQTDLEPCTLVASQYYCSSYKLATGTSTTMSYNTAATNNAMVAIALKQASSQALEVGGSLASLSSNCTATSCVDLSNVLNLNQQFASATGSVLRIQNSGNGADIELGKGTVQTSDSTIGNSIAATFKSGTGLASGNVSVQSGTATAGASGSLSLQSGSGTTGTGAVSLQSGTASAGTSGALTIQSGAGTSGTGALTIATGNASAGNSGGLAIDTGTASGTAGNITIGTGAYAHNVSIGNATGSTTMTLQTGTGGIVASSTATTSNAFGLTANALTSGSALAVSNTSTGYTGSLAVLSQNTTFSTPSGTSGVTLSVARSITANNGAGAVAVTLDAQYPSVGGYTTGTSANPSVATWNHTVANYSNRALVVTVTGNLYWDTCSATYGGVAMTKATESTNTDGINSSLIFVLTNPTVGTAQVSVSCASLFSQAIHASSTSWYNVNQASPYVAGTPANSNTITLSGGSATAANDMAIVAYSSNASHTTTAGQTDIEPCTAGPGGATFCSSYKLATGVSTTMSYATSATHNAIVAIALKQSATAAVNVTGAVGSLSSTCAVTGIAACADSSNILNLNQQYAPATGAVANIQNAGSGASLQASNINDTGLGLNLLNMNGTAVLSTGSGNLVSNPSIEIDANAATPTNWSVTGAGNTVVQSSTRAKYGSSSALVTSTGTAGVLTANTSALTANNTYTVSYWVYNASGVAPVEQLALGGTNCASTTTLTSNSTWTQYSCTITTAASSNNITFTMPATATNWNIDGVRVNQGSSINSGTIQLNGAIDSAVLFCNTANSTTAFQIQNSAGTNLLAADTTNMRVSVGSQGVATGQLFIAGNMPSAHLAYVGTASSVSGVAVQGRYAYVSTGTNTSGFQVFDVSNPAVPLQIGSANQASAATKKKVKVLGKYAYVSSNGTSTTGTFEVFDISNPKLPVSVGSQTYTTTGNTNLPALYVQGKYAFVGDGSSRTLWIFDVSNPVNMPTATQFTTGVAGSGIADIWASGKYLYLANAGATTAQFQVLDISTPTSPTVIGTISNSGAGTSISGAVTSLAVQGRYAYVGNSTGSVFAVDLKDPAFASPVVATVATSGTGAASLYAQGRVLYVADNNSNRISAVDISTPGTPVAISSYSNTAGSAAAQAVTGSGRYLYVGSGNATYGFQVFDMGGTYSQQLETGGLETDTLNVRSNSTVAGDQNVQGSLTVGSSTLLQGSLSVGGNITATNYATSTASYSTTVGATTNTTSITVNSATGFAAGDVIFINNAGQDYYTRIISISTNTFTVSPAVDVDANSGATPAVTKYIVQNIGAISTNAATPALSDRFFQGYFLGGVVTGAGSTTLSDNSLQSTGRMNYAATGHLFTSTATTTSGLSVTANSLTTGSALSLTVSPTYSTSATYSPQALSIARTITSSPTIPAVTTDVAFAGATSNSSGTNNRSITSNSATLSNQSNMVIVAHVAATGGFTNYSCSATYNGNSMTEASSGTTFGSGTNIYTFIYTSPTPGVSGSISVSCSDPSFGNQLYNVLVAGNAYYNVSTYSGYATGSGSNTPTFALSTGDLAVDGAYNASNTPSNGWTLRSSANSAFTATLRHVTSSTGASGTWPGSPTANNGLILRAPTPPITINGNLASLSSNCVVTSGSCIDSSILLNLNQQYASATGNVINISNSGTGNAIDATISGGKGINITNSGTGTSLFVNNTSTGKSIDIQSGGTSVFSISNSASAEGAATFRNKTNNATAFSIQNAAGSSLFNVSTTPVTNPGSLISNGSFETDTSGWTTLSRVNSNASDGSYSGYMSTTSTATATATLSSSLLPSTTYTLTYYMTGMTQFVGTLTPSFAGQNCTIKNWFDSGVFTCTLTTPASPTYNTVSFALTVGFSTGTVNIDAVRIEQGSTSSGYGVAGATTLAGNLSVSGYSATINSATTINNTALVKTGSSTAFQVQDASANAMFIVSSNNFSGGYNSANSVLKVAQDSGTNRSISAAGTINASGADYAEWIPWFAAKPDPGSIVEFKGQSMVVSSSQTAAFIGNDGIADQENAILVTFTGQVPVKISTPVNEGDFLVPNGDGTAHGVAPATASMADYFSRVGVALTSGSGGSVIALVSGPGTNTQFNPQANNSFIDLNVAGTLTTTNLVVTGSANFHGNIIVGGHVITAGNTPDTEVLGAAGAGATITIDGNDTAGTITITTGGGATAGDLGKLVFSNAFGKAPKTILSAQDEASQDAKIFPTGKSASQFILRTSQALPAGTYTFDYFIVQ